MLRRSLKSDFRDEAMKREASHIRYYYWVNGAMLGEGEKPVVEKEKPT